MKAERKLRLYHIFTWVLTFIYVGLLYLLPYIMKAYRGGDFNDYLAYGYDITGICRVGQIHTYKEPEYIIFTSIPFLLNIVWGTINMIRLKCFVPTMHKQALKKPLKMYVVFFISFIILDSSS